MSNMIHNADVSLNSPIAHNHENYIEYKIGYIELSSYCKGLVSVIAAMEEAIKYGHVHKISCLINSTRQGLGFVLDDIEDIERKLIT